MEIDDILEKYGSYGRTGRVILNLLTELALQWGIHVNFLLMSIKILRHIRKYITFVE